MMAAIRSSEMTVLTRAARRNIPEDGIFHKGGYVVIADCGRHCLLGYNAV
jgi:hypothetical protein